MTIRRISDYAAPALLVFCGVLAGANWYLRPERAVTWATTVLLLAGMTVVFMLVRAWSPDGPARRRATESIRHALVFAGLIAAIALGARLAAALGAIDNVEFTRRAAMATLGAFFVFTGNAMPKNLTPLSALQCDPARIQAFQRFAGWTWVLTGLAFSIVWLVSPIAIARSIAMLVLMAGMSAIATQIFRLRRTRQRRA